MKIKCNFFKALASCLLLSLCSLSFAQGAVNGLSVPVPGGLDSRIRVYAYSPDVVYTLMVTVGMHTHIQMGADEELVEKPKLGEKIQWILAGNEKNLYVKALKADTSTSMTLVTDKRTYQFELIATTKPAERIQMAYFNYPDEEEKFNIGKAKRIEKMVAANKADETQKREQELAPLPSSVGELSFYKIEGNDEFKRMHVFDNGVQTTMRMPPGIQDLPAIFMVDADNKLMPINYRVADRKSNTDRDVLTIERTAPRWLLKIGKSVDVKITKEQ